jgi:HEAT repeat protein
MTRLPRDVPAPRHAPERPLSGWIAALSSEDWKDREAARLALVSCDEEAIEPLVECLRDKRSRVRWEAAKALADLANPRAATALVGLLEDEESGVRWLAAEGLVAMQCDALPALLQALEHGAHSQRLREGAHHVIHELQVWKLVRLLGPVMHALRQPAADAAVPPAASEALDSLRREALPRRRRQRRTSARATRATTPRW